MYRSSDKQQQQQEQHLSYNSCAWQALQLLAGPQRCRL